ncbi:MAG: carbon storage regulator [Phycisphaerales bacterium]|nr:carbon storage regulator [Phycisphaerales bacterium]
MLVLTRRSLESVVVGGSNGDDPIVKVTVLEIVGGRVRLGFEVDAEIAVHRWELWKRIHDSSWAPGRTRRAAPSVA